MLRRVLTILCVCVLFTCIGCQTRFDRIWPLSDVIDHVKRVNCEVGQFHRDVRDNVFGIDNPQGPPTFSTYGS